MHESSFLHTLTQMLSSFSPARPIESEEPCPKQQILRGHLMNIKVSKYTKMGEEWSGMEQSSEQKPFTSEVVASYPANVKRFSHHCRNCGFFRVGKLTRKNEMPGQDKHET